jgi:DNA-binding protein H-NS
MGYWIVDGRKLTNEEYQELKRQEEQDKQRAREEAARLTKQLGEAYAALKEHLQRNPGVDQRIEDTRVLDQQIYQNLRQNLDRADQAPRCQAIKADGTGCGSPKMNNHIYCYAHYRMLEARAQKLALPALEDANGILLAVMVVQRALIDDEISEKKAGLLLYSLQIAAAKVDKTTFGQAAHEDLVTEMEDEEESIERQEQIVEKRKRVEEIKRGKTLPRINTDDTEGRSGDPVIGTSGDRVPGTAKAPNSAPNGSAVVEPYANLG